MDWSTRWNSGSSGNSSLVTVAYDSNGVRLCGRIGGIETCSIQNLTLARVLYDNLLTCLQTVDRHLLLARTLQTLDLRIGGGHVAVDTVTATPYMALGWKVRTSVILIALIVLTLAVGLALILPAVEYSTVGGASVQVLRILTSGSGCSKVVDNVLSHRSIGGFFTLYLDRIPIKATVLFECYSTV